MLFVISIIILVMIFPREGKFKYEFSKGKPWMHQDLIAPFDFAIMKSQTDLELEQAAIVDALKPYFKFDMELVRQQRSFMIDYFNEKWNLKYSSKIQNQTKRLNHLQLCESIYDSIMDLGIVEVLPETQKISNEMTILLIRDNVAKEVRYGDLLTISKAVELIQLWVQTKHRMDGNLVVAVLENSLIQNVKFDAETSEKEKNDALRNISLTRGMIQSGERIISKGELISADKFQVLESLRMDYESQLGSSFKYAGILVGQITLLTVAMVSLFLFLLFFRPEVFEDPKQMLIILLLIIAAVVANSLMVKYNPAMIYLIPVCLVPIIVGVFMDSRLALFAHLITIIISGFIVPNSFEYVFLQLFVGIITILSTVKLEHRSQFFTTSLMIFLTYSIIYTGMFLISEGSLEEINYFYYALFAGSALLTLFSYPVIFIFEKLFGLITNVTLMELSNTNNKLLRDLALKAPGTFQHSMQMANLAEEAIHEIGGNPLLVRTGAMYHDIGKMSDPLYFVENQTTGLNPHDDLTYEESAEIILDHVTAGVERAKKYNLPEQIIDFIRTHHGTRKTEYFYTLAQRDNPDEKIDDKLYTYPGPEPFSKETSVLMMADTVEAASRSLKKPNEDSIDALVENVINKQIESHQFDNADITFRDIRKIKSVFKKKLMNIYHLRIEYPK
jgi:putative nucleotidyltransferase with HDIG domain